jgi:F0F1-type ATP synthase assembly protein I
MHTPPNQRFEASSARGLLGRETVADQLVQIRFYGVKRAFQFLNALYGMPDFFIPEAIAAFSHYLFKRHLVKKRRLFTG